MAGMRSRFALPVPSWEDFRTFGVAACVFWATVMGLDIWRLAGNGGTDLALLGVITCVVGLSASRRVAYCSHRHARRRDPGPRSLLRP
jgi:hypothetical protein